MMKTLIWIIVIGLLLLLIKRIGASLVGIVVFVMAIFFSIFMLDTFTVVNVRDYINVSFYDQAKENPKETLLQTKDQIVQGGEAVIDRINDVGDKAQDRYNATSIVKPLEEGQVTSSPEEKEPEKEIVDPIPEPDPTPEPKEKEVAKENDTHEQSKNPLAKKKQVDKDGYVFIEMGEYLQTIEDYKSVMTSRDYAIYKALSPLITIEYEGDQYHFATERGVQGVYLKEVKG